MPKKLPKRDKFSEHELLDRSYLAFEFFSERVAEHQALKDLPQLRRKAEAIAQRLYEFYRAVGARTL